MHFSIPAFLIASLGASPVFVEPEPKMVPCTDARFACAYIVPAEAPPNRVSNRVPLGSIDKLNTNAPLTDGVFI